MSRFVRTELLHCIGESHCLRFSDLCLVDDHDRGVQTRVHFLTNVEAGNFTGAGGLHPDLSAMLVAAGLCTEAVVADGTRELAPAHRSPTFAGRVTAARHAALADQALVAPALLWFAGDKELHAFALEMGDDVDFELPGDPGFGIRARARRVPHEDVEASLAYKLRPFLDGLCMLTDAGFTRSLVHALVPRSGDIERVARWCAGTPVPSALRSKLALLTNRLLGRCCASLGLPFVDPWADLAGDGGLLEPRFDLDGVHLNRSATELTLPQVAAALAAIGDGGPNPRQYELLAELAVERGEAADSGESPFALRGWSVVAAAGVRDERDLADGETANRFLAAIEKDWGFEAGLCVAAVGGISVSPVLHDVLDAVRCALFVRSPVKECTVSLWDARRAVTGVRLENGSCLLLDPARVRAALVDDPEVSIWHVKAFARLPREARRWLTSDGQWPADPFRVRGDRRRWCEVEGKTVIVPRSGLEPVAAV
ncbi:MAG: hypothetical protein JNK78_16140 [Planctomycetes bacterium]|nr:hypothetical protein [Planctomycetota bacterium]